MNQGGRPQDLVWQHYNKLNVNSIDKAECKI